MKKKKFEFDEIVSITSRDVKNIDVYNLEVEEDESYCANRIAVHNCLTEMSYSMNNGYLASVAESNRKKGKRSYFVFSGSYNSKEKADEACNKWLGTIVRMVDKPLGDDKIQDANAQYAIWIGKNNVGRPMNDWWICIPLHPNGTHYWEEIDPEIEEWNKDINKIQFIAAA